MNNYKQLNDLFMGKNLLYIPIYSCFDYQTSLLNFKADGNINRFLSSFYHVDSYNKLTIFCPSKGNNIDWFINSCKNTLKNVNLVFCEEIQKSAKIERSIEFADKLYDIIANNDYNYDYIIVEAQHLYLKLYNNYKDKLVYWCPVCATNEKTRDFLEPFKELDKYIFSISKYTIIASNDQAKYYKSITNKDAYQIDTLIDRSLPCFTYKVQDNIIEGFDMFRSCHKIFLPFRLTDRGYRMQEIFDFIYNYKGSRMIKVFYSNPNNCDVYQFAKNDSYKKLFIDNNFINVSKDRDTYYTIIDYCNVIIPYFEDIEFICHAAINEFRYGNCMICKNIDELRSILN